MRKALAVLMLLVAACGGGDSAAPAPTTPAPTTSAPTPVVANTAGTDGRSVTGERLVLPPPPRGGFDPAVTVTFEGAPPIRAEVARNSQQRRRGLMQRPELPEGTGMLFLFPRRDDGGFYMLGTLIPLSIAYVDGDTVVSVKEMEPCPGQSCPTYDPGAPYTLAVEAPAGFFTRHGVKAGTKMTISGATQPPS